MGWKCTVCLVTNDEDAKVCVCCEYAREKDGEQQKQQSSGPIFNSSIFSSTDSSCPVFTFGAPANDMNTSNQNSGFVPTFVNSEKSPKTPVIVAEATPILQSVDTHQEVKEEQKQYFDKFNNDFVEYQSFIKKVPNTNKVPLGTVWVWGSGECDQLGIKEALLDEDLCLKRPKRIEAISKYENIVDISSGALHNLILTEKGEVLSWGCNDDGALGRLSSKFKAKLDKLKRKSDHDNNRNIEDDDDEDEDNDDEVDNEDEEEPEDSEKYPNKIEFPLDVKNCRVKSIVCGDCYSCCLTENGEVYLWGSYKDSGGYIGFPNFQLMSGSLVGYKQYNPIKVPIFGIKGDSSNRRNVGRKKIKLEKETNIEVVGKAKKIVGGENHTIVITEDMRIFAWGSTEFGQFGIEPVEDKMEKTKYLYPIELDHDSLGLPDHLVIQDIYCGRASTFFVLKDVNRNILQVFACGRNGRNELGIFENNNNNEDPIVFRPKKVNIVEFDAVCSKCKSDKPIKQIGGGQYYSALLNCCGEVFIWGMKDCCGLEYQLIKSGNEKALKERDIKVPTKIENLRNIIRLGFGADSCFAIDTNGILFVWGMNLTGQIGIKKLIDSEVVLNPQIMNPKTFLLDSDGFDSNFVLKVVGGSQHSMGLIWNGHYSNKFMLEEEEEKGEENERILKRMNAKRFDKEPDIEGDEKRKNTETSSRRGGARKTDTAKTVIKKIEKSKCENGGKVKTPSKAKTKTKSEPKPKTVATSKTAKTKAKTESKSTSKSAAKDKTTKSKTKAKTETKSPSSSKAKTKVDSKTKATTNKTKTEPKTKSKNELKTKPKIEPKSSSSTKAKAEPKTRKVASKTKAKTVTTPKTTKTKTSTKCKTKE
ncbi:Regulator of chromosome condensation (RCC1) repeat family protein [Cryptosporidium meleagridis]|uniref:Regulator of chromosome condensation (RCC1) repeat family protein n=1 Tax=Cryptosporidium meleagridis TaxID=93969 RepID=A0A2P4YZL7_9CRYT|nr:Regulator of chromosome condensation (RCC1) repeat family protein [Cryptosporidium meleagridis]